MTKLFGDFVGAEEGGKPISRIFKNEDFGYTTITVERPLRDEAGNIVLFEKGRQKGQPQPDSSLRDTENVPLGQDIRAYFEREVLPHAPELIQIVAHAVGAGGARYAYAPTLGICLPSRID